jgi:hypothetical protein
MPLLAQTWFPELVLARAAKPKMRKARLREVVRSEAFTRNCSRCSTIRLLMPRASYRGSSKDLGKQSMPHALVRRAPKPESPRTPVVQIVHILVFEVEQHRLRVSVRSG